MSAPQDRPSICGLGRTVPGWVLRAGGLVAGGMLVVAVLAGRSTGPFDAAPALVLLLLATAAPGGPLPGLFLVIVAATQLVAAATMEPSQLWRLPLAAALLQAVHTLCALAAGVPVRARLEVATLRRPALRWLAVQAIAAPVILGVGWLAAVRGSAAAVGGSWVVAAGLLAAAVSLLPVLLLCRRAG